MSEDTEVVARLRRIETRVHRIGKHLGMEEGTTTMPVAEKQNGKVLVLVPGWDANISSIKRAIHSAGFPVTEAIIMLAGSEEIICTIKFA